MTAARVTGLILAGGRARRLGGRNKALLRVGGVTMIDRVTAIVRPRVAELYVSVAEPATWTDLPTVLDDPPGQGPLAGIAAGLARAPGWLLAVAVDMPHLRGELLDLLLERAAEEPMAGAVAFRLGGLPEPLVALWSASALPVVARRLARGARKVAAALEDQDLRCAWLDEARARAVDDGLRSFHNVNRVEDVDAL
ncbi:MAG: molybdenum cofactor guanylyltransferase [Kofleriaceae bacterium]